MDSCMRHRESCNELTGRIGIRIYANGFARTTKETGIMGEANSREIVHYGRRYYNNSL